MPADPRIVEFYTDSNAPNHDKRNSDLARLVTERHNWPRLQLAKTEGGGWDVVVRIDGTYFTSREEAEKMLAYFAHEAAGVPLIEDDENDEYED